MSADNRICLMDTPLGWAGWHGSCSANHYEPAFDSEWFYSKQEALDWVNKEAESMVILEGGITIIGIEEQKQALKDLITDASLRLENLEKWNSQYPVNHDLNFK